MKSMLVGVIGTAGRSKKPHEAITPAVWASMKAHWFSVLASFGDEKVMIRSGGAAVADHLAVEAWKAGLVEASQVELHIPTYFRVGEKRYADDGRIDFMGNPGGTLNYYHRKASRLLGFDSLEDLAAIIQAGAVVRDSYHLARGNRLFARNLGIGRDLDQLQAYTWHHGTEPEGGGTAHCWSNSNAIIKRHTSLGDFR